MEINSKIHVEQPAPPGVHRQRTTTGATWRTSPAQCSQKRDKQTKNSTFLAASEAGEIRAPPNLAW